MPKITISNDKGLVQSAGSGVTVKSSGVPTTVFTAVTDISSLGANDVEMTLAQPANTVIVDMGWIFDSALAGSSGNSNIKFGTSDDGAELVAATAVMSSGTSAAAASGISLSGLKSEGAAVLAVVASAAMWTATARTIYVRMENTAAITVGDGRAWITYMYLPA